MAREDCPSCRPALDPHLGVARSLYCDELRTEYTSIALAAARDLSIPRAAGSLQARLYCDGTTGPGDRVRARRRAGSSAQSTPHDDLMRRVGCASHCAVLGIDYSLAPEHPFSPPLYDVLNSIRFVADAASVQITFAAASRLQEIPQAPILRLELSSRSECESGRVVLRLLCPGLRERQL